MPPCKISKLFVKQFRNLDQAVISLVSDTGLVIVGDNNHGKTSFLEALYYACHLKSCLPKATRQTVIQFDSDHAILGIALADINRYIKVTPDTHHIFDNQRRVTRPTQQPVLSRYISADTIRLFYESPAFRRAQLDALVRQYQPDSVTVYRRYNRLLSHRRLALKSGQVYPAVYDTQWVNLSHLITTYRNQVIQALNTQLSICPMIPEIIADAQIRVAYSWGGGVSPTQDYTQQLQSHISPTAPYTQGPHTDDFQLLINDRPSTRYYSRGINRMLALFIASAEQQLLQQTQPDSQSLMLLDDPFIELDTGNKQAVITYFKALFYCVYATVDRQPEFGSAAKHYQIINGTITDYDPI